jgi:hypothetical protein
MLRDKINDALKTAMKAGEAARVGTLRLMTAALKDRDIALRAEGKAVDEAEILGVLTKMVKQREDSAAQYDAGKRPDLSAKERAEIAVIQEFLPRQMNEAEIEAAVKAALAETGAASIKDMGRAMAALKARHAGAMDFGKASVILKKALGG